MKNHKSKKIGILGGSFDPAHKGHIKISIEAKKQFKIDNIIWAITKKNPFKIKSFFELKKRITFAKKITKKYNFISVRYTYSWFWCNRNRDFISNSKKNR